MEDDRGTKAIQRAIDVLDTLSKHSRGTTLADISRDLDLPKSTIHRILAALLKNGLVREDGAAGTYFLGFGLIRLSHAAMAGFDLIAEARPFLTHLNSLVDETVHLAVLDPMGRSMIYIDKIESSHAIRLASRIGQAVPIYCTGLGKAMLAFLEPQLRSELLRDLKLRAFTENTLRTPEALEADLESTRQRGYAIDNQEHEEGVVCVAAPIHNLNGDVLAAISISAPATRLSQEQIPQAGNHVADAAQAIRERVSYFVVST